MTTGLELDAVLTKFFSDERWSATEPYDPKSDWNNPDSVLRDLTEQLEYQRGIAGPSAVPTGIARILAHANGGDWTPTGQEPLMFDDKDVIAAATEQVVKRSGKPGLVPFATQFGAETDLVFAVDDTASRGSAGAVYAIEATDSGQSMTKESIMNARLVATDMATFFDNLIAGP